MLYFREVRANINIDVTEFSFRISSMRGRLNNKQRTQVSLLRFEGKLRILL